MTTTGPTRTVREGCILRSGGRCERCERPLHGLPFSLHHRRPRGMGGTVRPDANLASNLLVLCGTGTTGCHGWTEARRAEAFEEGLLIRQTDDPATVPVLLERGWVLLTDDYGFEDVP